MCDETLFVDWHLRRGLGTFPRVLDFFRLLILFYFYVLFILFISDMRMNCVVAVLLSTSDHIKCTHKKKVLLRQHSTGERMQKVSIVLRRNVLPFYRRASDPLVNGFGSWLKTVIQWLMSLSLARAPLPRLSFELRQEVDVGTSTGRSIQTSLQLAKRHFCRVRGQVWWMTIRKSARQLVKWIKSFGKDKVIEQPKWCSV